MMKQISRAAALLLLASLILTACGETASPSSGTAAPDSSVPDSPASTEPINEKLPDRDFGGHEFSIIATDEVGTIRYSYEIDADELNGDAMNDAVFKRNQLVEERFNVKITKIDYDKNNYVQTFNNTVLAGDDTYDALVTTYDTVQNNGLTYACDVKDIPYIDLDSPWWDGDFLRETELGGHIWGLTGDINVVDNASAWGMAFNKHLAEEFVDTDLYALVRDGKWTIDKLKAYGIAATADLNGDSKLNYDDRFGLVASANFAVEFIWSSGSRLSKKEGSGVTFMLDNEKNLSVLKKVFDLYQEESVCVAETMTAAPGLSNWDTQRKIFKEGRALFYGMTIVNAESFRDMTEDYGIIPMPKYDEDQADYACSAQEWGATMFMVPKNAPDLERTGILLDAMSSAAVSTITPAYFETLLEGKIIRDEESKEMLELIFSTRVWDPAYTFNWGSVRSLTSIFKTNTDAIASTIASMKPAVLAAYETLIASYQEK